VQNNVLILYLYEIKEKCIYFFFIILRLLPWVSYRRETAIYERWPVSRDVRIPERVEII